MIDVAVAVDHVVTFPILRGVAAGVHIYLIVKEFLSGIDVLQNRLRIILYCKIDNSSDYRDDDKSKKPNFSK